MVRHQRTSHSVDLESDHLFTIAPRPRFVATYHCHFHCLEPLTIPNTHNTGYRAAVPARAQVHGPVDASAAAPN